MTQNKYVLNWINEMAEMTCPDKIVWIDGTEAQAEALRAEACSTGEMIKLNQELLPNCYLHRTAINDVARVEGRTFICTSKKEDAGNINNWMAPEECYAKLSKLYKGSMKGRTMYVIPYSMSIVGSPFAKYGIELTDSIYVVLNMLIMTRVGTNVLEALGESGDFIKGLHARADIDEENRYICHFPEDNTIWSVNSGYGGNVLLGKKCFALRIASYLGRKEGWMAEHMLILGVEYPNGETKYICAAFPSACGKTNLAMLIPPELYRNSGYKVWCVGDDIAWLRVGEDGRLWAVNPENGFFGVAPGTNLNSNPNALYTTMKDTIFTNTEPSDIVAYAPNLITLVSVNLGGNKHSKVGLTACRGECCGYVLNVTVRILYAKDEHVLCHPALLATKVGSNTKSEALLTEKNVSAVTGVNRPDSVILGEMNDVSLLLVKICTSVKTLDEVCAVTESIKNVSSNSGHDEHIKNNVDRVGKLDTVLSEIRANNGHRVRDYIHGLVLIRALVKLRKGCVALLGIHPVVDSTCVLLLRGADEGAVLYTSNVVDRGSVKITAGELILIKLDDLSGGASLSAKSLSLSLGSVDKNDLGGLNHLCHLSDPSVNVSVFGNVCVH